MELSALLALLVFWEKARVEKPLDVRDGEELVPTQSAAEASRHRVVRDHPLHVRKGCLGIAVGSQPCDLALVAVVPETEVVGHSCIERTE